MQQPINKDLAEDIDFVDLKKEMQKVTPLSVGNVTQPSAAPKTPDAVQGDSALKQPEGNIGDDYEPLKEEPDDFSQETEPLTPKKKKPFLKGKGDFFLDKLQSGIIGIRKYADMHLEFTAEERKMLREYEKQKVTLVDNTIEVNGDIEKLKSRKKMLEEEWSDIQLDKDAENSWVEDFNDFVADIDFEVTPGWSLIISTLLLISPALLPVILRLIARRA